MESLPAAAIGSSREGFDRASAQVAGGLDWRRCLASCRDDWSECRARGAGIWLGLETGGRNPDGMPRISCAVYDLAADGSAGRPTSEVGLANRQVDNRREFDCGPHAAHTRGFGE